MNWRVERVSRQIYPHSLHMTLPVDPSSAITLAKHVYKLTEFAIRIARRDTVEMREWLDAMAALRYQLAQAQDSLSVVQDSLEPFMNTDGVAGQAAAKKAFEVGMKERVKDLHDHIASLGALFGQAQLDCDGTTRWDLIILSINAFAKERKIVPLDEGRHKLDHLVKHLDQGMKAVRDSYMRLGHSMAHSPIFFNDNLDSAATYLEKGFYDSPFCIQFHPTAHLAGSLLELMSSHATLPRLEGILTECGRNWVDLELAAAHNESIDTLERVERSHQQLVWRLCNALEKWQTSFPDLTKLVESEAVEAKEILMEWFGTSSRRYLALTLAIGGRVSEGKSSLLNAIIGKKILPTNSEFDGYFFSMGRGLMYRRGCGNGRTVLYPACPRTTYARTRASVYGPL